MSFFSFTSTAVTFFFYKHLYIFTATQGATCEHNTCQYVLVCVCACMFTDTHILHKPIKPYLTGGTTNRWRGVKCVQNPELIVQTNREIILITNVGSSVQLQHT